MDATSAPLGKIFRFGFPVFLCFFFLSVSDESPLANSSSRYTHFLPRISCLGSY